MEADSATRIKQVNRILVAVLVETERLEKKIAMTDTAAWLEPTDRRAPATLAIAFSALGPQ